MNNKPRFVGEKISSATVKELCSIDNGFAFNSKLFNTNQEGMPVVRIRDIKPGFTKTFTTEVCDEQYLVNDGDMLIGMDGEFNLTRWCAGEALLNQRVCRIRSNSKLLIDDYLLHFLPMALKRIEDRTACVTVKHLSSKVLNAIEIPLISIEDQLLIIKQLSLVERQINQAKQQIEHLDQLVKSRFVEMFENHGCKTVQLADVCEIVSGATPKTKVDEYWGGNIKWLTPAELNDSSHIVCDTTRHITEKGFSSVGLRMFPKGTVILSTRAPIGKVAIAGAEMCCNQGFKNLVCSDRLNNEYLYHYLRNHILELQSMGHGATFKELSKKTVAAYEISLPPLDLQQEFAAFASQVDKSRFVAQQQIKKLQMLYDSLAQDYFGD